MKGNIPEWTDEATKNTQLPSLVSAAHKSNAKALISLGGWSGSITFSSMASSASSRKEFIDWNIDTIKK
jgi:chitinase